MLEKSSKPFSLMTLLRWILLASPILVLFWPDPLGPGVLNVLQQRMLALMVFVVMFWILEPIPVFATSVLLIFLQLLMISDASPLFLRLEGTLPAAAGAQLGHGGAMVPYQEFFHAFASPVVMLFLGGFFLSGAASKYQVDKTMARVLLKPLGNRTDIVLLGVMGMTTFFSLWMANTPVTAMMLAIAAPIIGLFKLEDPGRAAFLLGIPIASSLGGMGTPVGTTTNGIALKYLPAGADVSFLSWMMVAVPYVLVLLVFAWFLLRWLFPSELQTVSLGIAPKPDGSLKSDKKSNIVYAVFLLTILLWLTSKLHGINIYTVALFPVAVFLVTGVINKNDLKKMSWDVLWLIAGGIALGEGLQRTGLTEAVLKIVPFDSVSPVAAIVGINLITVGLATIMSHTATANLMVPVVASLAPQIQGLEAWGGATVLIVSVGVTCSLGMALPISTPCNALAFSAGGLSNKQMLKAGAPMTVIGFVLALALIFIIGPRMAGL